MRAGGRSIRVWAGALAAGMAAIGCGDDVVPKAPDVHLSRGPVQPKPAVNGPLPTTDGVEHSPLTLEAPPVGYVVDARVLVISADGNDSELDAITQTLGYLGTPYDVMIASSAPTLTATNLASGMHGKYNAIILTRGNLVLSNGTSAFTTAEFNTL